MRAPEGMQSGVRCSSRTVIDTLAWFDLAHQKNVGDADREARVLQDCRIQSRNLLIRIHWNGKK